MQRGRGWIALVIAASSLTHCGRISVKPAGNLGPISTEMSGNVTGEATVTIVGSRFNPSELTIDAGTRVNWINQDQTEHTVTSVESERFHGLLGAQRVYSRRFSNSGRFGYYCERHPGMAGVIVVEPSAR